MVNKCYTTNSGHQLNYYEWASDRPALLLIHAQSTDASSYFDIAEALAADFHIYLPDCYGHGRSTHDKRLYTLPAIGNDLIAFIQAKINKPISVGGHSSGGLIAAYIGANYGACQTLLLEDPPFFSCAGERRFQTFNYVDLSTICHNFIHQTTENDFITYYFAHQYMWNFFPERSREKLRTKMSKNAAKYRRKHPDRDLRVRFWPKQALEVFRGMNDYDPYFGEAFYNDSFHAGIDHDKLLASISCPTLLLKAQTTIGKDGLLQGAMSDADATRAADLIPNCKIRHFACGHGIHVEKKAEFLTAVREFI